MINHEYLELFNQSSIRKDIDIAYDTDNHITNSDVVSGSFNLNESAFATKELRFGSLVASQLSVKLYNTVPNLMDKQLDVSIVVNNVTSNPLKIGKYKVLEDKPTTDRLYKQIKAYDGLYDVINKNVVEWYENISFPMTLKAFRDSFCSYVGITQVTTSLVNDNIQIEKTMTTNSLSGQQVLSAICELNGAIGRMNRDGNFEYVTLEVNPSSRITIDKIVSKSGSYEDFDSQPISKVQIRQTTDDIGAIVGENGNTYIVQDNFLVYGKLSADLTAIATNLLSVIEGISYKPFNIKAIYGNPCYEIGDAITVVTKNKTFNSYIFNRTLKGIQAMTDTIKADGVEYYTENLNSANVQIQQLKRQTNELTRTVEETKSTITSIETIAGNASEVAQKANQTATSANTTANNANTVANQANTKADNIAEDLENNYSTTVEMQSQIKQSADSITSTVSKTYATKTEVEDVMDNLDISNTSTGNYITVEDSGSYPLIEFYGYGKSEQKSYTGKNLLQNKATSQTVNGITFTVNNDGLVTASGTATANADFSLGNQYLETEESYIYSNGLSGDTSNYFSYVARVGDTTQNLGASHEFSFTTEADTVRVVPFIRIKSGVTVSNLTIYPMIRLASITDATYEPYIGGEASPNPSYPQAITSVADDNNLVVKSCGKNHIENKGTTQSINGGTITVNEDKSITVKGTFTENTYYFISDYYYDLPIGEYILSGGNTSNDCRLIHYFYKKDNDKTYIGNVVDYGKAQNLNVNDNVWHRDNLYIPSGATVDTTIYPMIRRANIEDATYEPYVSTEASITLTDSLRGIPVTEGGNYTDANGQQWICDTLEKYADGTGKLVQRLGSRVFNGTETTWNQSGTQITQDKFFQVSINLSDAKDIQNVICSHFTPMPITDRTTKTGVIKYQDTVVRFALQFSYGIDTLDKWKEWLVSNNVTVFYELATPIETPLTAEQVAEIEKLQTFNHITHVTTDDIGDIAIQYYKNNANADVVAQGNQNVLAKAQSSITQTADEIKLEVSKTYSTKAETTQAKDEAISTASDDATAKANNALNSANTNTDNKLKNYSTTVEMNSAITQSANEIKSTVSTTYATQESVKATTDNLQQQIDGAIETFTGSVVPTLSNTPAKDWTTTAIRDTHIGDLYIVNSNGGDYAGFYYRFEKSGTTYKWTLLKDTEVTKALQDAKEANEKADSNATDIGALATRVTKAESSITQNANQIALKVSKGDVSSQLSVESGQVTISGNRLVVDADNFKLDKDGKLKATEAEISGSITSNDATITGGSVNVVGNDENDSKIIVRNSTDTLNSKIAPSFISMHFGYDHDVYLSAGLQDSFGSSGLRIFDNSTRLAVGVSKSGLNFGYANSPAIDAQYTRTNMLVNGNANANGEFRSTAANGLRIVQGDYGFFIRNDGGASQFFVTNPGSQYGDYDVSKQAFYINNADAAVVFPSHARTNGGLWAANGGLAVGATGNTIQCIQSGSLVGTPSNTNSLQIFNDATLRSYYSGYHPHNTIILVANGDGNVFSGHIYSATYLASTAAWYAVMNINTSSIMRINYTIIMW